MMNLDSIKALSAENKQLRARVAELEAQIELLTGQMSDDLRAVSKLVATQCQMAKQA